MLDATLVAVATPDLPLYPHRYHVTAQPAGEVGDVTGVWSASNGSASNVDDSTVDGDALSVDVDVLPQQTVLVTLVLSDEAESVTRTLSITNPAAAPPPVPGVPPAPIITKDCAAGTLSIAATGLPANTALLELRRQKAGEATWTTAHTWTLASGATSVPAWIDKEVPPCTDVSYALRGGNVSGYSAWGPGATARLESATLTLAFTEPAAFDAPLSGHIWLGFSLEDASAAPTCELNLSVKLGGIDVPEVPVLTPASPCDDEASQARNGTYRLRLDTRLFRPGVQELVIMARGGDCCFKRLSQTVTLQNDLSSAGFFKEFEYPHPPLPGSEWVGVHLSAENRALSPLMRDRYYVQSRVSAAPSVADGAPGWAAMQPVELKEGQSYGASGPFPQGRSASTQLRGAVEKLLPGGNRVLWRTQWTPLESLRWIPTGYQEVVKIRPLGASADEAQQFVLLCRDTDKSRAGVLLFDGTRQPFTLTTLAAREDGDFLDACVVGDQVYALPDSSRIAVFDRDAGQFAVDLRIPEEPRPLRFLENVGGAPWVFAVGGEGPLQTSIRDLTFPARTPLFEVAPAMTGCGQRVVEGIPNGSPANTALAFGHQLWTLDGSGTPALNHTFGAPLNFATPTVVGLSDRTLWARFNGSWREVAGGGQSDPQYHCAEAFRGAAPSPRGIAGNTSLQLVEQSTDNQGQWLTGQPLQIPATIAGSAATTAVSALCRWLKPAPPTEGDAAPVAPDALLIGTRSGGLLGVLEQTDPATVQGAVVASELFLPSLDPVIGAK